MEDTHTDSISGSSRPPLHWLQPRTLPDTWWKEKSSRLESSEQSDPDHYMCSHCFANDWPRVVPETYTGKLPRIFRSPDLPQSKVQQKELAKEKEIESDKTRK
jgi:hypothetical protein